jgi:inhibitor of cysteine peptidase
MAELMLTEAQNGGRFTLSVGDTIVIGLPENAAAGYQWCTTGIDREHLTVESRRYLRKCAAVGSGGLSEWRLRATAVGSTRLALGKTRPWAPVDTTAGQFSVDLEING